jgi:hypothetical protein
MRSNDKKTFCTFETMLTYKKDAPGYTN